MGGEECGQLCAQELVNFIAQLILRQIFSVTNLTFKLFRWAELSTERLHFLCEVLRITLTTFQYRVRFIVFPSTLAFH